MRELSVYVDETGDPGWSDKAAPIFALSGVAFEKECEGHGRELLAQLRAALHKPENTVLHWKLNTAHEKRLVISNAIAASHSLQLLQVCMFKGHLDRMNRDPAGIYQYSLRLLVERASWLARRLGRAATVRISQIQDIGQPTIDHYMRLISRLDNRIEWRHLNGVYVHQPHQFELLQLADLSAGPIHRAFVPDKQYQTLEPRYLELLRPLMWTGEDRAPCPRYGFKIMPGPNKGKVAAVLRDFPHLAVVL